MSAPMRVKNRTRVLSAAVRYPRPHAMAIAAAIPAAITIGVAATLWFKPVFGQQSADATDRPSAIEELIVTARKVEESIQDIPMSVQVLDADLLDVIDTTHILDLQHQVAGLVVNNLGLNGVDFSLRGVSDQGGSSLALATHLNGVYLGSSSLPTARLFDLARIEILKGPQGTLYGRNATSGSINFITQPAQAEFSAALEAARGSFDTARLEGHVNLPFDHSALRIAGIVSEGNGFIRNSVDDRRFAEQDFRGLRLAWAADPTDRLRIDAMAQRVEDDGAIGELWLPRPDYLADPSDIRLATVTLANPFLELETDSAAIEVAYDLGAMTLQSVTGYAGSRVRDVDDCAGLPILAGCVRSGLPVKHEQLSQEFRLVSPTGGRLDWLAGVYLYDDDASRVYFQLTPVIDPEPTDDSVTTDAETTVAAFGQASWRLNDAWRMTAGLRLNHEEHRFYTIGTGTEDSQTGVRSNRSWSNPSWRLDVEYAASDEILIYAGVSTGFRSGGITVLPGGDIDTYDPEYLTAYETGVKSQWLDRRLTMNGAAFCYDYRDMQVDTSTITDDGLIFETGNAARAEIYGIDAQGVLQLADRLALSAGVVWLPKREFVEYRNDRTGDTLSGNRLTRTPEWSTTAAIEYRQPLPWRSALSARIEYAYRSQFFYTVDNDQRFSQGSFGLLNAYLRFEPASENWYLFAAGRNLGNEDDFHQVFLQSSPGQPDSYEAGFGYRF